MICEQQQVDERALTSEVTLIYLEGIDGSFSLISVESKVNR